MELKRVTKILCEPSESGCIDWMGECRYGYPVICIDGELWDLRKAVYFVERCVSESLERNFTDKSFVRQTCGNKLCLNVDHMSFHRSKNLTEDDRRIIRRSKESNYGLSVKFGVSESHISNIRNIR